MICYAMQFLWEERGSKKHCLGKRLRRQNTAKYDGKGKVGSGSLPMARNCLVSNPINVIATEAMLMSGTLYHELGYTCLPSRLLHPSSLSNKGGRVTARNIISSPEQRHNTEAPSLSRSADT